MPSSTGATGRVLIVDDDVEGGGSMAMLLPLYGYEVERATDLQSALQVGRALRPQAVLMDTAMPDADGYEVARRLSANELDRLLRRALLGDDPDPKHRSP
jgi:CheY-like chemotaxis protein